MHSVLIRNYKYRYNREGIIPGTWYNDFLLDPRSVSLGRFAIDSSIIKVNAVVTGLQDQDGKEDYDESFKSYHRKEPWLFTLGEDMEITDVDCARYTKEFQMSPYLNLINIHRYCTLIIDGTEYNNQYVQDHLNDLRILLDQIRTDALLEELDA